MPIDLENQPEPIRQVQVVFPEFRLEEVNDTGANGDVLLGQHTVLQKKVAIKIYFHPPDEIDQEPAIIAQLNHENVLKVFDARKVKDDYSYYMMEFANGGDLLGHLENNHLSMCTSLKLLCQLLSGLAYLHGPENRLVHRDIKLENILMHNDKLMIGDFGSVRKVDETTNQATASKHSILFRPPEAFGDGAFFDFSSDVYQAGIVGYLLFGGRLSNDLISYLTEPEQHRFQKMKVNEDDFMQSKFVDKCIEKRIRANRLLNWSSMPFFVQTRLIRVLKKSTAAHPNRFRSVSEFLAALQKIQNDLPDWQINGNRLSLNNWNGKDYLITESGGRFHVNKRGTKGNFRRIKSLGGATLEEAYKNICQAIDLRP